ncbi:hypothetical protein [Actinomyces israelii]|nr:hypothetical protein [Actinomyces israelii]
MIAVMAAILPVPAAPAAVSAITARGAPSLRTPGREPISTRK